MNNIFLFEYVVAGGLGTNIPRDIFLEGLAMYKALYLDLNNLGLKITTCIDKNLHSMVKAHLPLQEFTLVRDCNAIKDIFFDLCCQSEYCCLIAPQTDFILYNFSKLAEKSGTCLFGPSSHAIQLTSDKYQTYKILEKNGIKVPKTCEVGESIPFSYPIILKPRVGTGCENIKILSSEFEDLNKDTEFIVQPFIKGVHASCNLFSSNKIYPLCLNSQSIIQNKNLHYLGGETPFYHPLREKIFNVCTFLPKIIDGLKGFFGVDLVLQDNEFYIIEINARFTTSYLGLREALDTNPIQLFLDAIHGKEIFPKFRKKVRFFKSNISTKIPFVSTSDKSYGFYTEES